MSHRITIDIKNINDEDFEVFLKTKEKYENDKTKAFMYMIECVRKVERSGGGGKRRNDTLNYIDNLVHRQMDINKATTKIYAAENGFNAKKIKYEQRSITDRWIMSASIKEKDAKVIGARAVSQQLVREYINLKKDEIDEHHKWLCEQAGLEFTPENVRNFNRRTGKAAAFVASLNR